jgi:uncharacterized damage-inducible protein DinB
MLPTLSQLFQRDIQRVIDELNLYPDEASIWTLRGEIANSAGTLALHLTGNLRHFFGAALGNTGYVRTRDLEFSSRDVPRSELIQGLQEASEIVKDVLGDLTEDQLHAEYPLEKHGERMTTKYMLLHLLTHLDYHLGQINYHRRLCLV